MTRLVGVRVVCDGCRSAAALVFCVGARRALCGACSRGQAADTRIDLARTVTALAFCEHCDAAPALVYCAAEDAALCRTCDTTVHAGKTEKRHERRTIRMALAQRSVSFTGAVVQPVLRASKRSREGASLQSLPNVDKSNHGKPPRGAGKNPQARRELSQSITAGGKSRLPQHVVEASRQKSFDQSSREWRHRGSRELPPQTHDGHVQVQSPRHAVHRRPHRRHLLDEDQLTRSHRPHEHHCLEQNQGAPPLRDDKNQVRAQLRPVQQHVGDRRHLSCSSLKGPELRAVSESGQEQQQVLSMPLTDQERRGLEYACTNLHKMYSSAPRGNQNSFGVQQNNSQEPHSVDSGTQLACDGAQKEMVSPVRSPHHGKTCFKEQSENSSPFVDSELCRSLSKQIEGQHGNNRPTDQYGAVGAPDRDLGHPDRSSTFADDTGLKMLANDPALMSEPAGSCLNNADISAQRLSRSEILSSHVTTGKPAGRPGVRHGKAEHNGNANSGERAEDATRLFDVTSFFFESQYQEADRRSGGRSAEDLSEFETDQVGEAELNDSRLPSRSVSREGSDSRSPSPDDSGSGDAQGSGNLSGNASTGERSISADRSRTASGSGSRDGSGGSRGSSASSGETSSAAITYAAAAAAAAAGEFYLIATAHSDPSRNGAPPVSHHPADLAAAATAAADAAATAAAATAVVSRFPSENIGIEGSHLLTPLQSYVHNLQASSGQERDRRRNHAEVHREQRVGAEHGNPSSSTPTQPESSRVASHSGDASRSVDDFSVLGGSAVMGSVQSRALVHDDVDVLREFGAFGTLDLSPFDQPGGVPSIHFAHRLKKGRTRSHGPGTAKGDGHIDAQPGRGTRR